MTDPNARKKLKENELQAAIMERLLQHPECEAITQVYVKPTGLQLPEETWTHTLISRRATAPLSNKEKAAMHAALNELRAEFDILPD